MDKLSTLHIFISYSYKLMTPEEEVVVAPAVEEEVAEEAVVEEAEAAEEEVAEEAAE